MRGNALVGEGKGGGSGDDLRGVFPGRRETEMCPRCILSVCEGDTFPYRVWEGKRTPLILTEPICWPRMEREDNNRNKRGPLLETKYTPTK